jgi:regulator of sigma E protease
VLTIAAFIVTIGILVTIHEYGHFIVARWCDVRVLKFSIGFGKPLFSKTFGEDNTEFILAAIPLGGYVKMLDEREIAQEQAENKELNGLASQDSKLNGFESANFTETELKHAFNRQVLWKKMAIVLAGPLANLLLAIALYWLLFMKGATGLKPIIGEIKADSLAGQAHLVKGAQIQSIDGKPVKTWQDARWELLEKSFEVKSVQLETLVNGNEPHTHRLNFDAIDNNPDVDILEKLGLGIYQPVLPAKISEVLPNSAAAKAGLLANDKISQVNGKPIANWDTVVQLVQANPGNKLSLEVLRGNQKLLVSVIPEKVTAGGKTIGRLGASTKMDEALIKDLSVEMQYSAIESLQQAAKKTWETSIFSLKMLGKMVTGQVSIKGISGPVTIASYAGESAGLGVKVFLSFLALVSISIGVLNLLPVPVLDGGHLMYYVIEFFKGSPVSDKTMLAGQKIGFGVLSLLMSIAIFNDINRLMTG